MSKRRASSRSGRLPPKATRRALAAPAPEPDLPPPASPPPGVRERVVLAIALGALAAWLVLLGIMAFAT